ncbi:MAG: NADH-quinone oxidoreductase subunit NuoN [Sedimenticolaceae bacterium]|jgi:NADH-quinone oxidoreductase subunit N
MQFEMSTFIPVMPEIVMLVAACVVLIVDLFLTERTRLVTYALSLAALVVTGATIIATAGDPVVSFEGSFVRDAVADVMKIGILTVTGFAMVYAKDYLVQQGIYRGEYYTLALFSVLGMMIMSSAYNFITIYLGLELLALSMYALVAFNRDSMGGAEAAMKYFVLGALASGLLLYGISLFYGATGSLSFAEVSAAIVKGNIQEDILVFGLVFIIMGVGFKFGAVPFHMWVPDVYHGAPTAVTILLGSAPKIAAFALTLRLLVDGLAPLFTQWQEMLMILAVISLGIGNLVAIAQHNIKRMLAYSTISHVGFIFLGFIAGTDDGYGAALFYTVVYALTAAGGFGVLAMISRRGFDAENLDDLKGLNERSGWLAAMMALILFSMAGVPPTVGFFAKWFVLESIIRVDLVWLALVAVFFSVIGAFYYLRAIKTMYFDKPIDDQPLEISADSHVAMSINGVSMLVLGMFPTALYTVCRAAFG